MNCLADLTGHTRGLKQADVPCPEGRGRLFVGGGGVDGRQKLFYNWGMTSIKAVLFDLDGTLTVPCLDFAAMKAEMGIAQGYILEEMERMSPEQREHAQRVLDRHEEQAARMSQLNPGAAQTLTRLRAEGRKIGLITRNCHTSVKTISELHDLKFDAVVTREDSAAKPAPDPVLRACVLLKASPDKTVMVGDYLHDMQAGRAAGTFTVLLCTHPNHRDYHGWADFVIDRLDQLHGIIETLEFRFNKCT